MSSYGRLSPSQEAALAAAVRGRDVIDLGAGSLDLAKRIHDMGARSVLAVDYKDMPHVAGVERERAYFEAFAACRTAPIDLLFTSWPSNYSAVGLTELAQRARTVVYLGKNTDGTTCASPDFFEHLLTRRVLAYLPTRANVLIVYGGRVRRRRAPLGEEVAGLLNRDVICSYDDV